MTTPQSYSALLGTIGVMFDRGQYWKLLHVGDKIQPGDEGRPQLLPDCEWQAFTEFNECLISPELLHVMPCRRPIPRPDAEILILDTLMWNPNPTGDVRLAFWKHPLDDTKQARILGTAKGYITECEQSALEAEPGEVVNEYVPGKPPFTCVCGGEISRLRHALDGVCKWCKRSILAEEKKQSPPPSPPQAEGDEYHTIWEAAQDLRGQVCGHTEFHSVGVGGGTLFLYLTQPSSRRDLMDGPPGGKWKGYPVSVMVLDASRQRAEGLEAEVARLTMLSSNLSFTLECASEKSEQRLQNLNETAQKLTTAEAERDAARGEVESEREIWKESVRGRDKIIDSMRADLDSRPTRWVYDQACKALHAAKGDSAWQPIETAPKDGTPFLAYDTAEYRVCWWHHYSKRWTAGQQPAYEEPGVWPEEEWPTYWRPLPAPPSLAPAGGELGRGEA